MDLLFLPPLMMKYLRFFACNLILSVIAVTAQEQKGNPSPDLLMVKFNSKLEASGITPHINDPSTLSHIIKWAESRNDLIHCSYWLEYHLAQHPENLPLRMALADCYFIGEEWQELMTLLENENWDYQEHFRLAYLAFAYRELNRTEWMNTWMKSITSAAENTEKTKSLIHFLAQWKKWDREIESLLWKQIHEKTPLTNIAYSGLVKLYELQNNPEGLLKVNDSLLEISPDNSEMLNNHVILHILTSTVDTTNPKHLKNFMAISETDPKYQLTKALFHESTGDPSRVKKYLQNRSVSDWSDPEYDVYLYYLADSVGFPKPQQLNANLEDLLATADLLGFEKSYLSK